MRRIRTQADYQADVMALQQVKSQSLASGNNGGASNGGGSNGGNGKPPQPADDLFDRITAYIPAEIIALYLPLVKGFESFYNLPEGDLNKAPYWVCQLIFLACLVLTPLYLWFKVKARDVIQFVISTVAFVFWAMCLSLGWFHAVPTWVGALLLPLFTFAVGFYEPKK